MLASQMGDHAREKIFDTIKPVFDKIGVAINKENIWNDLLQVTGNNIKSTFYIKNVDNVIRKDFNLHVEDLKQTNKNIVELKVKFKRPEKEVRFFIELANQIN
jgi:hypothetical protein